MAGTTFEPTPESTARGELIRHAREQKGWSQLTLAKKVRASRVSVTYWETGKVREIETGFAIRLNEELGIPLHFLLTPIQRAAGELLGQMQGIMEDSSDYELVPRRRQKKRNELEISDPALTLAAMWDGIPDEDPSKVTAKTLIEQAHRRAHPNYERWESERKREVAERHASRKKSKNPTT